MRVKRTITAVTALTVACMLATGCTKEADDVNKNLTVDADNRG
jgi:hypothetical protein